MKKLFAMPRSLFSLTAKGLPTAVLLFAFALACRQLPPEILVSAIGLPENSSLARYEPSALQKMQWLAGVWKGEEGGRAVRQSFQFHDDKSLEIIRVEGNGDIASLLLSWHEGRYYYGQNRQWAVTWIGEKDIRFDPLTPGLEPMTWTRLDDRQWHLVRHAPEGDETTVMERAVGMQP